MIQLQGPDTFGKVSFKVIEKVWVKNDGILLNILSGFLSLRGAEMKPIWVTECALMIKSVEFIIDMKLMLRAHSITVSGDNLSIILNCSYNIRKTIEFGEILFWCFFNVLIFFFCVCLFFLSFLSLLRFISRWCLLSSFSLNIEKYFIWISSEDLCIEIWG